MNLFHRLLIAAATTACVATPLAAQNMSVGSTFLKAVRERDGAAAEADITSPGSTVINTRDQDSGEGALHILVRGRDLNWLVYMLGSGARTDIGTGDGTTPLGLAAQIGWLEGAEELIRRGANVNLGNSRGETPLILAVQGRHAAIVDLLVRANADPHRTDNIAGMSALDYARQDSRDPTIRRLLEAVPQREQAEVAGPPR